jgi:hypothetical protein
LLGESFFQKDSLLTKKEQELILAHFKALSEMISLGKLNGEDFEDYFVIVQEQTQKFNEDIQNYQNSNINQENNIEKKQQVEQTHQSPEIIKPQIDGKQELEAGDQLAETLDSWNSMKSDRYDYNND